MWPLLTVCGRHLGWGQVCPTFLVLLPHKPSCLLPLASSASPSSRLYLQPPPKPPLQFFQASVGGTVPRASVSSWGDSEGPGVSLVLPGPSV